MNELKLLKDKVVKDGRVYTDLYLSWSHNSKVYLVRIEPRFAKDWKLVLANAKDLTDQLI